MIVRLRHAVKLTRSFGIVCAVGSYGMFHEDFSKDSVFVLLGWQNIVDCIALAPDGRVIFLPGYLTYSDTGLNKVL